MADCDNIKYEDLKWCDGTQQLPGIKPKVYSISKRDIVVWPVLPKTADTMAELAVYVGSFVLAANAVWREVGVLVDKSPITGVSQGTKPSKTSLNTGVFMHPGVEEEATGFVRQANNDDLVYAFEQKNGKFRILGNSMYQSETDFDQTLGGAATDEMGTKLTCKVTDLCPAPFYNGEIVTIDGIINENFDKVASVTFTPDGGTVEPGVTTIALATATAGASIAYKIGTGAWQAYAVPIVTTGWAVGDHVIIAKAVKAGLTDSNNSSATYHV